MTRHGLSDSQANAEALARRSSPYGVENSISVTVASDYRRREPRDLREAVLLVRRAYADEMPDKLHDSAIGEDGTPRMNARAVGYIFGDPRADDAGRDPETGERDLVGHHYTPFRAKLDEMSRSSRESHRKHAAIVEHVTLGGQEAVQAAIAEGVPSWCAGEVAYHAIRAFLNQMSSIRIHAPKQIAIAESYSAA